MAAGQMLLLLGTDNKADGTRVSYGLEHTSALNESANRMQPLERKKDGALCR